MSCSIVSQGRATCIILWQFEQSNSRSSILVLLSGLRDSTGFRWWAFQMKPLPLGPHRACVRECPISPQMFLGQMGW